jgi:hypothetical protein
MNAEPPPLLNPNPDAGLSPRKPASLGALGMRLSYVAPAVFLLFTALRPG